MTCRYRMEKKKSSRKQHFFFLWIEKQTRMHNGCSANPCFTIQLTQKETSTF